MQIGRIQGCTRVIGKSQGYIGLPLRDVVINERVNGPETPAMETAWLPSPAEIAAINAGAPVILRVLGTAHPPVMLEAGPRPTDEEQDAGAEAQAIANNLAAVCEGHRAHAALTAMSILIGVSAARVSRPDFDAFVDILAKQARIWFNRVVASKPDA